jgi:hypothetical protein
MQPLLTLFNITEPEPASRGGVYTEKDALALLNSTYFIGKSNKETGIFRINADGSATFVPPDKFKIDVQNIFVETVVKTSAGNVTKKTSAEKFWKEHPGAAGTANCFQTERDHKVKRIQSVARLGRPTAEGMAKAAAASPTHPRSHLSARSQEI